MEETKGQLRSLYSRTWAAMIEKDAVTLSWCHADDFVIIHMTGTRQPKPIYIRSILDGTLNYYSEQTDSIDINITDPAHADVTGRSIVAAAVYGGSRHTWHLLMQYKAIKGVDGKWRFSQLKVSTY